MDGSSRARWYPASEYGWKVSGREKLSMVYLPIGSEEGS